MKVFFFAHSSSLGVLARELALALDGNAELALILLRNYEADDIAFQKISLNEDFYGDASIFAPFFEELLKRHPGCEFVVPQIYSPCFRYIYKRLGPERVSFAEEGVYFYSKQGFRYQKKCVRSTVGRVLRLSKLIFRIGIRSTFIVLKGILEDKFLGEPYLPYFSTPNHRFYSLLPVEGANCLGGWVNNVDRSKVDVAATFLFFPSYTPDRLLDVKSFFSQLFREDGTGNRFYYTEHPANAERRFTSLMPENACAVEMNPDQVFSCIGRRPGSRVYSWSESVTLYLLWLCECGYDISVFHQQEISADMHSAIMLIEKESGVNLGKKLNVSLMFGENF